MSTRQDNFEILWSLRHDVPAESLKQYRFETKEGYRLPDMASHFRTYCDTLNTLTKQKPKVTPAISVRACMACGSESGHGGLMCPTMLPTC